MFPGLMLGVGSLSDRVTENVAMPPMTVAGCRRVARCQETLEYHEAMIVDGGAIAGLFLIPIAVALAFGSEVILFQPNPVLQQRPLKDTEELRTQWGERRSDVRVRHWR
jgi:hypothetical protein